MSSSLEPVVNESEVIFTMPGKAGDALMQWPVAYWWARENGKKFTLWLDEKSCKIVEPLFAAQPCVEKIELRGGIENYNCGGQPWHFNVEPSEMKGKKVFHLGFRTFPNRQLTLECKVSSGVPLSVDNTAFCETNSLAVPYYEPKNRLVLHGQGVCPHTRSTPLFWKFLYSIRQELESKFDEIVFVGSEDDIGVGKATYPNWKSFSDGGDFYQLAGYLRASQAVIACGSSVAALAGALKVPCVRVHDVVGNDSPKVIWSNLGENQLNDTEIGLRTSWPEWRDRWL